MQLVVRNVNDALPAGLQLLLERGERRDSRNGPVRVFTEPVMTVYQQPRERVLLSPARDCNPFFHLFESLWMLAGRNDVAFVSRFVKRMRSFSDDGKTLHGAYGKRWIGWFADDRTGGYLDQLQVIIDELRTNPDSRRCVIDMWDGHEDLVKAVSGGKDVPCNTQAFLAVGVDGRLDMTLINRSNDMVWGAYGANAVHFSYLQEFIAAGVGVPVGRLFQFSNNLHGYDATVDPLVAAGGADFVRNPYDDLSLAPFPLVSSPIQQWREDLSVFMAEGPVVGLRDPFFRRVAIPMWVAHEAYRTNEPERFSHAREALSNCKSWDWRRAAEEWLDRREAEVKARENSE